MIVLIIIVYIYYFSKIVFLSVTHISNICTIASVSLSSLSGFTLLDNAAIQILTQLAKVKQILNELVKSSLKITISIEYAIH